ncbi:hypothetical protein ACFL5V_00715 [Fibrobacterota bacterium]
MDKDRLLKLAQNPNLISGIYNYCDRWCERCAFTVRCLNYLTGEEQFPDQDSRDLNNDTFWDKLGETFRLTMEMIKDTAEEEGIDLDAVDAEEIERDMERQRETAQNHECSRAGDCYAKMVKEWFEKNRDLFKEKEKELMLKHKLELTGVNPEDEANTIKDSTEIIHWYQYQIYVKMVRGVSSSLEDPLDGMEDYPKDSDGSVKVALIGMDRSMAAWGQLYKHFPEQEDEILDILVHLERLRRKTESHFPEARAFVRPGFDTDESCCRA